MYWHVTGTITYNAFASVWNAADMDRVLDSTGRVAFLPSRPTDDVALRRALSELEDKRTLVRPLARGQWAVVQETVMGDRTAHVQVATAKTDIHGMPVIDLLTDSTAVRDAMAGVMNRYAECREELTTQDMSMWLSRLVPKLDAVTLRERGGVYFIPRDRIPAIRAIAGILRVVSQHVVFEIPALASSEAADAVLASLEAEALTEINEITEYLDETNRQTRAYVSRSRAVQAIREKVARYEQLFGRRMANLDNQIQSVRRRLGDVAVMDDALSEGRSAVKGERAMLDLSDIKPLSGPTFTPDPLPGERILDLS